MKGIVLSYRHQKGVYFDFKKEEMVMGLTQTCYLPTQKIAKKIIEERDLSNSYEAIEVEIEHEENNKYAFYYGWLVGTVITAFFFWFNS